MNSWLKTGRIRGIVADESSLDKQPVNSTDNPNEKTQGSLNETHSQNRSYNEGKKSKQPRRKYDEQYLDFGFIESEDKRPKCLFCGDILSMSSMAPAKLRRHQTVKHPEHQDKTRDFFEKKRAEINYARNKMMHHAKNLNENVLRASYLVSYHIAKAGKPYDIGEKLIKPCLKDVAECCLDEKSTKIVGSIPLSNDTVSRRTKEMADDVRENVVDCLKSNPFSMQLDESTDIAGMAILMVFARYQKVDAINEDLLMCETLKGHTTSSEIFSSIKNFFTHHNIPWQNCIDICTDGARAMIGNISGVVTQIKKRNPEATSSPCMLHRHALAAKAMPSRLKEVMDQSVKIINFIKARPLNSRLFKLICEDFGSLHLSLLLHTEVRWLSRGKALTRLVELREETAVFLQDKDFSLSHLLNRKEWILRLSYLADIFQKINECSLNLQGKSANIFEARNKIEAFKRKLIFWLQCVIEKNYEPFERIQTFLAEQPNAVTTEILDDITEHLKLLLSNVESYFPPSPSGYEWVRDPFSCHAKPPTLNCYEYEQLIDLKSDDKLKDIFSIRTLEVFWVSLEDRYSALKKVAIKTILPFPTTYLCEAAFSNYTNTKTKYRNRLNPESQLRLQLTQVQPNFEKLTT